MNLINKYVNQLPFPLENCDALFINILSGYLKDVDLGLLTIREAIECTEETYLEVEPFV